MVGGRWWGGRQPRLVLVVIAALALLSNTACSLPSRSKLTKAQGRPPPNIHGSAATAAKSQKQKKKPKKGRASQGGGGGGSQVSTYVTFHDSSGAPIQLRKKAWDRIVAETQLTPMDVSPAKAMQEERRMNARVASGELDETAWHAHQYVMASTGNVDSARILLEYGVAPSLQKQAQEGTPLQLAAQRGDYDTVEKIVEGAEKGLVMHEMSQSPLCAAAMMGHADIVALLLREGHDPESKGANGATPLMLAASVGHLHVMDTLLQAGAAVDGRHKFAGSTALHFAAEMGQEKAVRKLCAAGADVEAEKNHGGRPLHTAADTNQPKVVAALLECGAERNSLLLDDTTPLYLAAQNGYTEVARVLVEHRCVSEFCRAQRRASVDFEMPSGPSSSQVSTQHADAGSIKAFFEGGNGATAIHAACENGHLGVVKVLAENGVDVNTRGMQGVTPLYSAISYNHPAITRYLLVSAKADPNTRMKRDGASALVVALTMGRGRGGGGALTHLKMLLEEAPAPGCELELRTKQGHTALMVAVGLGQAEAVALLLSHGADPNAVMRPPPPRKGPKKSKKKRGDDGDAAAALGGGGTSVLEQAVEGGDSAVVSALLRAGAQPAAVVAGGQSALHTAAAAVRRDGEALLLRLLLRALAAAGGGGGGGGVDARVVSSGATALMVAARAGHAAGVRLLLEAGADPNARAGVSLHGATALYLACEHGRLEAAQQLVRGAGAALRLQPQLVAHRTTPLIAAVRALTAAAASIMHACCAGNGPCAR
jgi:ankyrin repeat protein